jgi:hypothetical protein
MIGMTVASPRRMEQKVFFWKNSLGDILRRKKENLKEKKVF